MSHTINIIAAIGQNRELGNNNQLLWHLPEDLKRFKELTNGHPVIMGRKTFESIPEKFRPLPNRTNIVVSRNLDLALPEGVLAALSLEEAIVLAQKAPGSEEIFIIGGGQIYTEAVEKKLADRLYLTLVEKTFPEADVFFPEYQTAFPKETSRENKESEAFRFAFLTLGKQKSSY